MVRRMSGRPAWLLLVAICAVMAFAMPSAAQSTGMVKGTVTDEQGKPVDGARIAIEMTGGTGRRYETKSNNKGEFIQIGIAPGSYQVTAEKEKLASAPGKVSLRANQSQTVNLVLGV